MPTARECAQQIISAHVVTKDLSVRDKLIDEYVDELGDDLLTCVFDFVHAHLVADVNEDVAVAAFYWVLTQLGRFIESLSEESGESVFDITMALASIRYGDDPPHELVQALKAAQTCLLIHMMVRRGEPPWGIQSSLNLTDMCAVVHALGDLMWTQVQAGRDELGDAELIRMLLDGVHNILEALAHAHDMSVSALVVDYWCRLALSDCQ